MSSQWDSPVIQRARVTSVTSAIHTQIPPRTSAERWRTTPSSSLMCRPEPAPSTSVTSPTTTGTCCPTRSSMCSVSSPRNSRSHENAVLHVHWFPINNVAVIASASLQRRPPECWLQPTKFTRSSKITGPCSTAIPSRHPSLKLLGELMNPSQRKVLCVASKAHGGGMPLRLRFKDSRSSTLDGDPYILHDNGTLEIHVAQDHNSGRYTCVARNSLGINENHIYLEVKGESGSPYSYPNVIAQERL